MEVDEEEAVDIEMGTGEAALFAYRIAHVSCPNRSDDRRIAVANRNIPRDARQTLTDRDSATPMRGKDPGSRFEHETMPAHDLDPPAVEFHRHAEEQHRAHALPGNGSHGASNLAAPRAQPLPFGGPGGRQHARAEMTGWGNRRLFRGAFMAQEDGQGHASGAFGEAPPFRPREPARLRRNERSFLPKDLRVRHCRRPCPAHRRWKRERCTRT